jgi:hypothetical protein
LQCLQVESYGTAAKPMDEIGKAQPSDRCLHFGLCRARRSECAEP